MRDACPMQRACVSELAQRRAAPAAAWCHSALLYVAHASSDKALVMQSESIVLSWRHSSTFTRRGTRSTLAPRRSPTSVFMSPTPLIGARFLLSCVVVCCAHDNPASLDGCCELQTVFASWDLLPVKLPLPPLTTAVAALSWRQRAQQR